jgi:hypothetical protein
VRPGQELAGGVEVRNLGDDRGNLSYVILPSFRRRERRGWRSTMQLGSSARPRGSRGRPRDAPACVGRRLLQHVQAELRQRGVVLVQVKTFGPSGVSEEYERTRAIYVSLGFLPLDERTDIWGPDNPCLISVKPVMGLPERDIGQSGTPRP